MKRTKVALAATAFLAGVSLIASGATATADPAPQANDIVGVGSDTIQIVMNNIADGTKGALLPINGYNANSGGSRLITFDATSGTGTVVPGDQITLRRGAAPVNRPQGSTAGKSFLAGAGNNTNVNFARSSDANSAADTSNNLWMMPFATDGLKMAVANTTNAPASLTDQDVVDIYEGHITTWNQIPGNAAGSTAAILPLYPQVGSGTEKYFVAQMKLIDPNFAYGGAATNQVGGVPVEEHSPVFIKDNPNAIAPFSTARGTTTAKDVVTLLGGFSRTRAVYNVVRQADLSQPWFTKIFGPSGYICSPTAKAAINAAGFPQLKSQAAGGVCGVPTQVAPTNLATS